MTLTELPRGKKAWEMTRDEFLIHAYLYADRLWWKGVRDGRLTIDTVHSLDAIDREQKRIEAFVRYRRAWWQDTSNLERRIPLGLTVPADIAYACRMSGVYEQTIEAMYRTHVTFCQMAVSSGYQLPEAVLAEYPSMRDRASVSELRFAPRKPIYEQLHVTQNATATDFRVMAAIRRVYRLTA